MLLKGATDRELPMDYINVCLFVFIVCVSYVYVCDQWISQRDSNAESPS